MLKISCPVCGLEADETEFHAGGEAHLSRPASAQPDEISAEDFRDYLFIRKNPRGIARELWQCTRGCGKWFHAARNTMTMEFTRFYRLSDPQEEPVSKARSVSAGKTSAKKTQTGSPRTGKALTARAKTEEGTKPAGKSAAKPAAKPKPKRKTASKPQAKSKGADK